MSPMLLYSYIYYSWVYKIGNLLLYIYLYTAVYVYNVYIYIQLFVIIYKYNSSWATAYSAYGS